MMKDDHKKSAWTFIDKMHEKFALNINYLSNIREKEMVERNPPSISTSKKQSSKHLAYNCVKIVAPLQLLQDLSFMQ